MKSSKDKKSFNDVASPTVTKPVKTGFVFETKRADDGMVERYKSRVVARGFTQHPGLDFFDMFSLVVGLDVLRTVLVTTA